MTIASTDVFLDQLTDCLKQLDLEDPEIQYYPATPSNYRYFVRIVSKSFERINEAVRQEMVFRKIFEVMGYSAELRIEFIYTDTPAERERKGL